MRRHRGDRADLVRVRGLHGETVAVDHAEQAVRAVARVGGGAAALEELAHVDRQRPVEARADGEGGDHRRVARAPRDDDLRAEVQRLLEGLVAHLADDARGGVQSRR